MEITNITANVIKNSVQSSKTTFVSPKEITTQTITPIHSDERTVKSKVHALHNSTDSSTHRKETELIYAELKSPPHIISTKNTNTVTASSPSKTISIASTEQTTIATTSTEDTRAAFKAPSSSQKASPVTFASTKATSTDYISTFIDITYSSLKAAYLISTAKSNNPTMTTPRSTEDTTTTPFERTSSDSKTTKPTTESVTHKPTTSTPQLCTISIAALHLNVSCVNPDPCLLSSAMCINGSAIGTIPSFCECSEDGMWTIIQKRFDGSTDFYRNWTEYKDGFGELKGEFWLGNDALHQITTSANYTLKIYLTGWDNKTKIALYDTFRIDDEFKGFSLTIGGFSGEAGDSLTLPHNGRMFSTSDRDNDGQNKVNWANEWSSGWWFVSNSRSNLNGLYRFYPATRVYGVMWTSYGNGPRYSMKETKMLIKLIN